MADKTSIDMKRAHIIYAVLVTVLALGALTALVVQRSLLETPTQSASVGNATPTFTNINTATSDLGTDVASATGFTFTENETKNVYLWGVADDANGCAEITSASAAWSLKFYRNDTTPGNCTSTNYTSCYQMGESPSGGSFAAATGTGATNGCSGSADTDLAYEFQFPIKYFSPPTDTGSTYASNSWTSEVTVTDYNSATASTSDTIEINSLAALDITESSISYGSLALGGTSATSTSALTTIKNTGNKQIDLSVTGATLTCDKNGTIAPNQIKYDSISAPAYASMRDTLTGSASTTSSFDLAAQTTTSSSSSKPVYWAIQIPSNNVSGSCSAAVTISAVGE